MKEVENWPGDLREIKMRYMSVDDVIDLRFRR